MLLSFEQIVVDAKNRQSEEFSLVLCGPLYRLLLHSKLIQPPLATLAGDSE